MTRNETKLLIAMLLASYQNFRINDKTEDVWTDLLQDLPFETVKAATKRLICLLQYPPTIADIRKQAAAIVNPETLIDAAEAWGEVEQALRYYPNLRSKEAPDTLTPLVRRVVDAIGWRRLCQSENMDVIRGEFLKMFASHQARAKEQAALPPAVKRVEQLAAQAVKAIEAPKTNLLTFPAQMTEEERQAAHARFVAKRKAAQQPTYQSEEERRAELYRQKKQMGVA